MRVFSPLYPVFLQVTNTFLRCPYISISTLGRSFASIFLYPFLDRVAEVRSGPVLNWNFENWNWNQLSSYRTRTGTGAEPWEPVLVGPVPVRTNEPKYIFFVSKKNTKDSKVLLGLDRTVPDSHGWAKPYRLRLVNGAGIKTIPLPAKSHTLQRRYGFLRVRTAPSKGRPLV